MERVRKNSGGFTVLEIICTLMLFSMIITVSLSVTASKNNHMADKLEIMNIYADVCDARNLAITSLETTRVRFFQNYNNSGKSAYLLQVNHNNMWKTYKRVILPDAIKIYSINFPGNNINQSFSFSGIPSYTGNVTILINENGLYQLVFYSSGRIRVKNIEK